MSTKNAIILSPNPRGVFYEGTITGAISPGTVMQVDVSEGVDGNGHFTWEPYAPGTDGDRRLVAVLLPNELLGKVATDAYATGDHGFVYCPVPGELMNMLVANVAGTSDTFAVGDLMMVNTGDGKLIATTGSPESEPFFVKEAVTTALTADTLVECVFTGY